MPGITTNILIIIINNIIIYSINIIIYITCHSFTLIFISFMLQIVYNPAFLVDKYMEYMNQKHQAELVDRNKYDQMIKNLMPTLLYKYRADRV